MNKTNCHTTCYTFCHYSTDMITCVQSPKDYIYSPHSHHYVKPCPWNTCSYLPSLCYLVWYLVVHLGWFSDYSVWIQLCDSLISVLGITLWYFCLIVPTHNCHYCLWLKILDTSNCAHIRYCTVLPTTNLHSMCSTLTLTLSECSWLMTHTYFIN